MRILNGVSAWLVDRLGLERITAFVLRHPVPEENVTRRIAWAYVLGVATLTAFLLQVVTGVALATRYIPSAAHAFDSLVFINREVWFGWLLRGMHYVGASAMVVLIFLHMVRVFLTGSFKYPREMNWVLGVILLLLTLLMAASGQLLRWDQDGIWTVTVGSQILARVPYVGQTLAQFVLAGDRVGGSTLTRFFAFHVLILPGLIFITIGFHVYLVLHHGISEPPVAGRPVDPSSYRAEYRKATDRSPYRYWPDAAWREVVAGVLVVAVVLALALIFGAKGPNAPPDPTTIAADPRPDWYFRWYYALLAIKPRGLETLTMVYVPLLLGLALLVLPFIANQGERHPARRPWAIAVVGLAIAALGVLTGLGIRAPWSMAFETEPLHPYEISVAEGVAWEGSQLFHSRGCQLCHTAAGRGGSFGPDLTEVTLRLPPEVIVTRTLNGIRDMPAYREILSREEMNAILAFLKSLEDR